MKKRLFNFLAGLLCLVTGNGLAQTFSPSLIRDGKDTLIAFPLPQARELLKRVTKLEYRNQEISNQQQVISSQESKLIYKDQIIHLTEEKLDVERQRLAARDSVLARQDVLIAQQQKSIAGQIRQTQKWKRRTRFACLLGLISTVLGIAAF